jgi:hypothetical protein
MGVKVAFREALAQTTAAIRAVSVPKAAVHQQDGRDVVLVVHDNRAERRAITVSSTGSDDALVGAGLSSGEKVILEWPIGLTDGVPVKEIKQ